ncbi:MAG: hypothetical protein WCT36_01200 [Candidatus Gracilibacteria bacterium]|jgi:hypothetical protein
MEILNINEVTTFVENAIYFWLLVASGLTPEGAIATMNFRDWLATPVKNNSLSDIFTTEEQKALGFKNYSLGDIFTEQKTSTPTDGWYSFYGSDGLAGSTNSNS